MDVATAMALRKPLSCWTCYYSSARSKESRIYCKSINVPRRRAVSEILSSGFCDEGHLQYYSNSNYGSSMNVMSGEKEKKKPLKKMKKKKQLKLLKGLTRDLSTCSQIGFGLQGDDGALLDQVKGNMISEATEHLLEQLHKMRAQEKEVKRKAKKEKSRAKAAAQMQNSVSCEMQSASSSSSSSSSSSESSDSECGEVLDMNKLKQANTTQTCLLQQVVEQAPSETKTSTCSKKIEVCMGGKCRKSGGGALLEEFERAVGIEGVVSGCKCMGKCREGPNVKVGSGGVGGAAVHSLCVGVGPEDVSMIVGNLLGENQNQLRFAAAS